MRVDELDFVLPPELLAREPPEVLGKKRDESRLMIMKRSTHEIFHTTFNKIGEYLRPNDLIVVNNSRTINALLYGWLHGKRRTEVRLCSYKGQNIWHCYIRPTRHIELGSEITFGNGELRAIVIEKRADLPLWILEFKCGSDVLSTINKIGRPILSPYVSKQWALSYYQTPFASNDGSAEMPAAGRHFTQDLLDSLRRRGIEHTHVTLHTGLSSLSVNEKNFDDHKMYEEWYRIDGHASDIINRARDRDGRILSVGTTVTRVLETVATNNIYVKPGEGWTNLYIYPGHKWKIVDMLVTNFHGPRTSRIALAASFTGKDLLMEGYRQAIVLRYRFYEFGDTTLTI